MPSDSHHPHDRYFKSVFAHLEVMEEYVQHFMPKELAGKFNLETLQKQPGSFVDNDLQEFFSDVVYTVRYGKSKVNITLLIEHKSSKPKYPWLQLLQYMVNAYTAQTKEKGFKKFSPVIPIILYHGMEKWPEKAVFSYFKGMDPMLTPFIPEFKYLLSDLSHYSSEELLAMKGEWVKRVFLALKMGRSGNLSEAIQLVLKGTDTKKTGGSFSSIFSDFLDTTVVYLLKVKKLNKEAIMRTLNKIDSPAKERAMSAYDHILQEGIEKGMEEGMEKGFIKAAFLTFKKGVPMGLSVDDLITLTSISANTAVEWHTLLTKNPEAELPAA